MSKLLFNRKPIVIDVDLAKYLGLNESIILQQLHYWIEINKETKQNFYDGRTWVYNSIEEWHKQFPFWSKNTISRTFDRLIKQSYVITGNYNKLKFDKTKWYTIDYLKLKELENRFTQNGLTSNSNWVEDELSLGNTIPEINTEIKTKITKDIYTPPQPKKINYAEFVSMTEDEYQKLITQYGEENTRRMIEILDNYKGANGKKYKSDYRAILNWVVDKVMKEGGGNGRDKPGGGKVPKYHHKQREYEEISDEELERAWKV